MTARALAPGIWAIAVPVPAFSVAVTQCYAFVGAGSAALVDPGWDDAGSLRGLADGLAEVGIPWDAIRLVVATHAHPDHVGLAAAVRERTGAAVAIGEADVADAGVPIDLPIGEGDELLLGDRAARVVATPGHTPGSLCLDLADDGLVLTGDTVLPHLNPGIGLGATTAGNPIRDYLASLDRLGRELGDRAYGPGHGDASPDLGGRCATIAAHHRARTAAAAAILADDPDATAQDIAPRLSWTGGWDALGALQTSALRQTEWHRELAVE